MLPATSATADAIRRFAHPLASVAEGFDPLIDAIGEARVVLLGEASHGTQEFYAARAAITRRLVEERGFRAVIVEADWPDAYRVNRYVRGAQDDADGAGALEGFRRFPQWMWRNHVTVELINWMRRFNGSTPDERRRCGFYGMDLYSLYGSIEAVLRYLQERDPQAARRAKERYACFEHFGEDPRAYGMAAGFGMDRSCESAVVQQLIDLQRAAGTLVRRDGESPEDEFFYAEQNARLVANAEAYYRRMFAGHDDTWNLRDTHMTDTIEALMTHLDRTRGGGTKVVVWAHNSHVGDARATQMGRHGEVNVGQLCRERWGRDVFNLGFTTHTGTVTAAHGWGDPAQTMSVKPSLEGSVERLFHETGIERFLLLMRHRPEVMELLSKDLLERAIGVIYRPRTERQSHYFAASVSAQFDAVIHVDRTTALEPLERTAPFEVEQAETYPTGV